jgi:imidazolonepropionase-like amidohydrolase
MKRITLLIHAAIVAAFSLGAAAQAQQVATPKSVTLFSNVRIFDGKSAELSDSSHVLVRGNLIEKISTTPIPTDRRADTVLIDGGGRTLMPGLIDMHWHAMLVRTTPAEAMVDEIGYINIVASAEAADTLMRGFTTVRDLGGPVFALKRAIDEGIITGPRIYPAGAMISITGGHGDFRLRAELPRKVGGPFTRTEQVGQSMIADSPDEVRMRVREQLLLGASQIKLTAGGGVASPHSPLDVSTFTSEELRAAVEAAENWGTYVTVHAYTPAAIQRAIASGVHCIEHGHLMNEATMQLMAEKGIWLSMQPFPEELGHAFPEGSPQRARFAEVVTGTDTVYRLAKKHKVKTAWGTDVLFSRALAQRQGALLAKLVKWYTPAETLKMATGDNAQLLALSGRRTPYAGKLGIVAEGTLADLLLVDGNPLENIDLVADPAKNFVVIMKDGKVYKNTLK